MTDLVCELVNLTISKQDQLHLVVWLKQVVNMVSDVSSSFITFVIMEEKPKAIFNKRIFWDVNFEQIDYDAKANFVIERGDVDDIRQCRRNYGDEKVTTVLLNTKFLPEHRIHLASAVTGKPLNEFRCYILRQLNPGLYPY